MVTARAALLLALLLLVGHAAPQTSPSTLPRIVWVAWMQGWSEAPFLVQQVVKSIRFHNEPLWNVRLVDASNLVRWLPSEPGQTSLWDSYHNLTMNSDFVRMLLLAKYGGVWSDSTVLVLAPYDDWLPAATTAGRFFAFNGEFKTYYSSWFMAAHSGSVIMRLFADKCAELLTVHAEVGCSAALKRRTGIWPCSGVSPPPENEPIPPSVKLNFLWIDLVFGHLYAVNKEFQTLWDAVPYVHLSERNGFPGSLYGRHSEEIDAELEHALTHHPPNVIKLSRHIHCSAEDVSRFPRVNTNFAITLSSVHRTGTPVRNVTLQQYNDNATLMTEVLCGPPDVSWGAWKHGLNMRFFPPTTTGSPPFQIDPADCHRPG